jgi:hypothetical protein
MPVIFIFPKSYVMKDAYRWAQIKPRGHTPLLKVIPLICTYKGFLIYHRAAEI